MKSMLDLTQNRYSSQWRAENAESERDLAAKGRMSAQMAKQMKPGMKVDFYTQPSGNKESGTVLRSSSGEVEIESDSGKIHKFKVV